VLPSLWEVVAGTRDVEWGVQREDGRFEFTPEMGRCWRWKDELPERRLVCVGKHLGRWQALVAPRLVAALWSAAAERRAALGPFEREVADAVGQAGPSTAPQLRELLGADKKELDKAIVSLQRALVLTNACLVEQRQGWGAIALELVERRWTVEAVPDAAAELVRSVLASSGEVSAADVGGALGWRLKPARTVLDELVEAREATRRDEDGLTLYSSI
jgi:winged helix DNA-binding protein